MLASTSYLLVKTHSFFDEIHYHASSEEFDPKGVLRKVVYTINHAKTLGDALYVAEHYLEYLSEEKKFIRKCAKHSDFWDYLKYKGRHKVKVVGDQDSFGAYYISNLFGKSLDDIHVSSVSLDKGLHKLFDDGFKYDLRESKQSEDQIVLVDSDNRALTNIALTKKLGVYLTRNKTKYASVAYPGGTAIFGKSYIDSLKGKKPDFERHCKAFIAWDAADEDCNYYLACLSIFDSNIDFEMMFTLAAGCFMVFKKHLENMEKEYKRVVISEAGKTARAIMFSSALFRRR